MVTQGIFSQFERDELNKITAKSILEKLMNIRQKIDVEFIARRLIWELMQNAKDNAALCNEDGEKVDVAITLGKNDFVFSHNKGYFTNEHIRGLIRKYSSSDKNRDIENVAANYKTTGRFGTGFMTTHLLSEKVQVDSYYQNENKTYNKFSFWLDRTGKTESAIIEGINNAFAEAENSIEASSSELLNKNNFQTSFIYPLTDPKRTLAKIAVEEVKKSIAYTLINVPEISSVTISEEQSEDIIYTLKLISTATYINHELQIYNLFIGGTKSSHYYLAIPGKQGQMIIPISYNERGYFVSEIESTIPRLHLDFPMIGTEDLNLPFIINSSLFEPTEPRDGISLIDDEDNEIAQKNCEIVLESVDLYIELLSFLGERPDWHNLYNLARIKYPQKHSWIDFGWFDNNVISPIRTKLLHTPIVDVVNGERISIWDDDGKNQVYFPTAAKDSIIEQLWELSMTLYPGFIPLKDHINQWSEIIWSDCYEFSISELSAKIHSMGSLNALSKSLDDKETEAIRLLNEYYRLLNSEGQHIKDILSDEYAVIPNQLGEFKEKSKLYLDKDIDDELKNVCGLIGNPPRGYLIHKQIHTGEGITYYVKKSEDIILQINNALKEDKNANISKACDYLVSLFLVKNNPERRKSIYAFSKKIYPNDFIHQRILTYYDERIWEESDKKSLFYIVSKIADYKAIDAAYSELGFVDSLEFIEWLHNLVLFLASEGFENNLNRIKHPILPNQRGIFCIKDDLFLDDGSIHEELKDISHELGYDFRSELLDKSIYLELPENRTYTIENVAEKISSFIKPVLRDVDKRKQYKETLKKFYIWMNANKLEADRYFSDLFEKRFLFLEDDDISVNIKKASDFDQVMQEYGIKSIEELKIRLAQSNDNTSSNTHNENEKINITKEILASLGVTSPEELEQAFKDPLISSRFIHTSTPTIDMFLYAQTLIERAKKNIINYMKNHSDYDCTDLEETAPTILAGILKKGLPIQIVTRPSDNGEVIVYYSSEKDTLDSDSSELWVDNGIIEPHILTLGRILKSTGINKIPINMN